MGVGRVGVTRQTENEVEEDVITWLKARGWRPIRQHVGLVVRGNSVGSVGKRGMCDWKFERPAPNQPGTLQSFEWEAKATGKKPSKRQREYMALRTHQGFLCCWFDSLAGLRAWYRGVFGEEL